MTVGANADAEVVKGNRLLARRTRLGALDMGRRQSVLVAGSIGASSLEQSRRASGLKVGRSVEHPLVELLAVVCAARQALLSDDQARYVPSS